MLIALNFHYIREKFDEPYPSIFGVTPQQFSHTLEQLDRFVDFLSIEDIVDIIQGRKKLPEKAVVITFDDGFKEQYELAWPILKEKGIPAIFFVNTQPIEEKIVTTTHKIHILRAHIQPQKFKKVLESILRNKDIKFKYPDSDTARKAYKYDKPEAAKLKYFLNHSLDCQKQSEVINECFTRLNFNQKEISRELYMTKDMTKLLARSGVLGTHGHSHKPLGLLHDEEAIADFKKSIKKLKNWTGQKVKALSYPFGYKEACSKSVAYYASKYNVKFAFTMERAGNINLKNPLFLARYSNSDLPDKCNSETLEEFWENIPKSEWYL